MARVERIRIQADPSVQLTYNAMSIVAYQAPEVMGRMMQQIQAARAERQERERQVLGGEVVEDAGEFSGQSDDDMQSAGATSVDSLMDAAG